MDIKEAGRLGGIATAKKLSKEQRSINASRAAQVRWKKVRSVRKRKA